MRIIGYERVSTVRQGASGLGIAAQRQAIEGFAAQRNATLIARFTEVESGRNADRPELKTALHLAKVTGATLVIAKLDRLSRNAAFLLTLRDSGVRFAAVDLPEANDLTVGIMALVAQQEREATSRRTKEALSVARSGGVKLGNPNGAAALKRAGKGGAPLREAIARNADRHAQDLAPVVEDILTGGALSLRAIAAELNGRGMLTRRGRAVACLDGDEPARPAPASGRRDAPVPADVAGGGARRESSGRSLLWRPRSLWSRSWGFTRVTRAERQAGARLHRRIHSRSYALRRMFEAIGVRAQIMAAPAARLTGSIMGNEVVVVGDKMQASYRYELSEPEGQNFDPDFRPELTPPELLRLGIFGGKYMTDCRDEFPSTWFIGAKLSPERRDPTLNLFGIHASQPLSVWRDKGWLHKEDPRGWFQWYCRYYRGRRMEDDPRQIKRWKAMRRHVRQIERNCENGDIFCRRRQRQALLHWAYDSRLL